MLFSDEQLLVQLIEEDNFEAFEELLNRYEKPLFNFLAKSLDNNYYAAQDCFQETFYRIYKHRKTYNPKFKFKTWLYSIANNLCIDEIRKKTFGETGIAQNELKQDFNSSSPEIRLIRNDMEEKISSLVRGLPEKLRTVLILSQYEKFQLREIAALLSIPEGTVKSRLNNAFKKLILLAEQGGLLDDLR